MPELVVPPVPHILNWIGLAFAIMSGVTGIVWGWQRFLTDWWASRTRERVIRRAKRLVEWAAEIQGLRQDRTKLGEAMTLCMMSFVMGVGNLMIAFIFVLVFILADHLLLTHLRLFLLIMINVFLVLSYVFLFVGFYTYHYRIRPAASSKIFQRRATRRLDRLFKQNVLSPKEKTTYVQQIMAALAE